MKDYNETARKAIDSIHKVGRISKLYGTAGEVVIKLYDAIAAREFIEKTKNESLWVEVDTIATPFFVATAKSQGAGAVVATFDYIDSEPKAQLIIGAQVYLQSVSVKRERATDWDDLVGFDFEDVTSGVTGKILEIVDNSLSPLMFVRLENGEEIYLPLAEELIVGFDAKKRLVSLELVADFFQNF